MPGQYPYGDRHFTSVTSRNTENGYFSHVWRRRIPYRYCRRLYQYRIVLRILEF
jgi:hypothetical protein